MNFIELQALAAPAGSPAALVLVNQDHRRHNDRRGAQKRKGVQRKSAPMKDQQIAHSHGDSRQKNDEE
jgi:hypothetical protein